MSMPHHQRLARVLLGLAVAAAMAAPPWIATARAAAGATFVCPVEDRTTRPNSGGAPVATFPVAGVDLSHWNSPVSFSALRRGGRSFAYFKATHGTSTVDGTYAARSSAARAAGLLAGAYHFFDWRISGVAQARYFVAAVNARGGFHRRLPPVVDVECSAPFGRPEPRYAVTRLRAFISEVDRLIGVKPIIYTSIFEWGTVTGDNQTFGDCLLWSAEWAKTAPRRFPPGFTGWTFWQYGAYRLGVVKVDGDVFNGSLAAIRALVLP
jgi:GH25 family lysozyme M1 (1,4-beta-N-acetylmuramidase)